MAFSKTGLSTVISNVEVTPEVKAEIVEEKCDCAIIIEEKKEITTEE